MGFDGIVATALGNFMRLLTGVQSIWHSSPGQDNIRVYYANHRSHGDFVLVWSSLPQHQQCRTRPVAAADYWLKSALRRYLIQRIFRGVLIDRKVSRHNDPIAVMSKALMMGDSLILFPEGTRNQGDDLLPFKAGMYHLAQRNPDIEFLPVWIENLGRALPKGSLIPVPLLCSVTFGRPLKIEPEEAQDLFLQRARNALLNLSPCHHD